MEQSAPLFQPSLASTAPLRLERRPLAVLSTDPPTFFTFAGPFAKVAPMRSLLRHAAPVTMLLSTALGLGCEDRAPAKTEVSTPAPAPAPQAAPVAPREAEKIAEKAADKPVAKKPVVCPPAPALEWSDPALEKEVRRKASKVEGNITLADVRKVRSVDLTRSGVDIESLDPCIFPQLTSLHHLYIGKGSITDLSPIKTLVKLEGLRISMNPVSDIGPLAGMLQMDRLDLGRTQVRDLTPLKKMNNLTELMLDDTPVDDVTPLAGLAKLERLSIKRTRVTDISPLKSLRKLKFLYVGGSPVESSGGLARPGLTISSEE
jgi:internalin A